jgi:hypothetical protein
LKKYPYGLKAYIYRRRRRIPPLYLYIPLPIHTYIDTYIVADECVGMLIKWVGCH